MTVALTANQTGRPGASSSAHSLLQSLKGTRGAGASVQMGNASAYNATGAPLGIAGTMRRWVSSFASPAFDGEGAMGQVQWAPAADAVLVGSPLEEWHYLMFDTSLSAGLPPEAVDLQPGEAAVTVLPGWMAVDQWTLVMVTREYDDEALQAAVKALM